MIELATLQVQAGSSELLLDDALEIKKCGEQAGVHVELQIYPEMFHAFQLFSRFVGEGQKAVEQAGVFVKQHTPSGGGSGR